MSELDLSAFLAARLSEGGDTVGISSNAMVREALGGTRVEYDWEYPHDHHDLSRCCATWAKAPWSLKAIMLPRLTAYCEYAMNGYRKPAPAPTPLVRRSFLRRFIETVKEAR
jgi:hypothetical protein